MKNGKPLTASLFDGALVVPLGLYTLIVVSLIAGVFFSISPKAIAQAFSETAVLNAVKLSFLTSVVSTFLAVIVAVPAAYALSRYDLPGKGLIDTLLHLPIVLPPLVMGLSVLIFFNTPPGRAIESVSEFVYTWRGIILVQFIDGCAFGIRVIKAGFDSMNVEYENVAMILGAGRAKTFFKVSLPLASRSIMAGAIISWTRIFGLFGPVILVSGTMRNRTEIMPTTIFLEASIGRIEVALVIATLMILICMGMLFFFNGFAKKGRLL